ncbi:MAG TPA: hypothetical protein VNN22_11985 [Verrucomicrobiae bacterium]|nr:hypothetical protein [Verrucomicrobiae bacterium]
MRFNFGNSACYFYLGAICILFTGCAPLHPYRTSEKPVQYDHYHEGDADVTAFTNIIEVATNYTLGFVEFDDQGWLYNRTNNQTQIETVVNRLTEESKTNGLLMVLFIHGWKHNASGDDSNVALFHNFLQKLADIEKLDAATNSRPTRRVAGIYVGWRGLSLETPIINNLTFWTRKTTAEQVGHGEAIELLAKLEQLRNTSNRQNAGDIASNKVASTKLVSIGHSFGGDLLYCATAPILAERMIENYDDEGQMQAPKPMGDLVILINPAVEAARFETLERLSNTKTFPVKTCTLAIFTSTSDDATGIAFPAGRWFSTLSKSYQADTDQWRANRIAIGHYEPFLNYELSALNTNAETSTTTASVQAISKARKIKSENQKKKISQPINFPQAQLVPKHAEDPTLSPIFNVAVNPRLIPNHNKIDRTIFIQFLAEFIALYSSDEKQ